MIVLRLGATRGQSRSPIVEAWTPEFHDRAIARHVFARNHRGTAP
jgi:hypothetical protein